MPARAEAHESSMADLSKTRSGSDPAIKRRRVTTGQTNFSAASSSRRLAANEAGICSASTAGSRDGTLPRTRCCPLRLRRPDHPVASYLPRPRCLGDPDRVPATRLAQRQIRPSRTWSLGPSLDARAAGLGARQPTPCRQGGTGTAFRNTPRSAYPLASDRRHPPTPVELQSETPSWTHRHKRGALTSKDHQSRGSAPRANLRSIP